MAHFQFLFYIFCIIWNESYLSKYLVTQLIWHANPDNWRPIHSKKRLKFPDYCKAMRLHNYLNFTLFTFNKIRILIQYLVAKIGMIISWLRLGCK
ncbi:hypothetical protein GLOIN_2v677430 [Rhizophagus irregularis DAOM 181602=DAOM 197198]|uniref:Uncharacterized protein n=1 Tax=Rhizophagus irregularis (strain DAOM 181602 / DAOM 197198 / MUCL 43194) TaxID=747089 RepID=A0A2P4QL50_RHIID|nr:hypothetical protein GLOIN_2v677430 [Rhizophagus irregularis DAOM 181602=DAOM 197198]POG78372.1 hypothetical protein GLOIN_2v677430 [Rhizophagus irregularis DAOM 181602=DAOM 197198]|eukprot:XP_025185238.1 hypothetical protein GLOIN_2v677430 [Rhizophagus irregularis DAOM 181602=DAOM 197198]